MHRCSLFLLSKSNALFAIEQYRVGQSISDPVLIEKGRASLSTTVMVGLRFPRSMSET